MPAWGAAGGFPTTTTAAPHGLRRGDEIVSYHDTDTCLQHTGLQTWTCPDCINEHDQQDQELEDLPTREYLYQPTPIEVVSGLRAEGDPDGR